LKNLYNLLDEIAPMAQAIFEYFEHGQSFIFQTLLMLMTSKTSKWWFEWSRERDRQKDRRTDGKNRQYSKVPQQSSTTRFAIL